MNNELTPFNNNWRGDFDSLFNSLHDEMFNIFSKKDRFLTFADRSTFPKVNQVRKDEDIILEIAIPHYHPENVKVFMEDGKLVVKGDAVSDNSSDEYLVREVAKRAFTRSWQLPADFKDGERIVATYERGVLFVTLKGLAGKKKEVKSNKEIKIQVK